MELWQVKLQKKRVFDIFTAYFLPQHHAEMYTEQVINKMLMATMLTPMSFSHIDH